jgi:hypothetical protein
VPIPPIDYTTPTGQVRLLIADVDIDDPLFSDAQIAGFLAIEADVVKRAAARALDVIAVSEALVSKVMRTQDLTTDGAKLATALRAQAKALRDEAAQELDDSDDGFFFEVVSPRPHPELAAWPIWPVV